MKFQVVKVIFILLICTQYTKQGWISDKIGGFFGNIVDKSMSKVIDRAKEAFRESCDYLFDQKIKPMIDQIEAAAERTMDHVKEDIDEMVDHVTNKIEEVIDIAAKTATEFVDHTIEEIKDKVIDNTFDHLKELENNIFEDITRVLNKVDEMLRDLSCYAQSVISRIENDIKRVLPSLVNPFEYCRKKLNEDYPGIRWKFTSSLTHEELYMYRKCLLIKNLTPESKTTTIAAAYREIELLAGDMRCLSVALSSISNEKFYIREMGLTYEILHALEGSYLSSSSHLISTIELGIINNELLGLEEKEEENKSEVLKFLN